MGKCIQCLYTCVNNVTEFICISFGVMQSPYGNLHNQFRRHLTFVFDYTFMGYTVAHREAFGTCGCVDTTYRLTQLAPTWGKRAINFMPGCIARCAVPSDFSDLCPRDRLVRNVSACNFLWDSLSFGFESGRIHRAPAGHLSDGISNSSK